VHFTPIDELPFPLGREEIERLFAPFVARDVKGPDPEWERMIAKRKRAIARKLLRRYLMPWRRDSRRRPEIVAEEYDAVWETVDHARYDPDRPPPRHSPWEWHGRRLLASTYGATRFRQLLLVRVIEHLRPRRVLEVGCGNGINLILLAGRFPEIAFTGIELTAAGHRAARALQQEPRLPPHLLAFAPLPIRDPGAHRRIDFRRGNAAALPFADGEFDLVFTVLALEQMERIRHRALAEIARVTRRHLFTIEPFRDVNARGWERLNVLRRNYFRGRIDELRRYGLTPVFAFADFPQERFLKACAVLAEKQPVATGAPGDSAATET